MKYYYDCPIIAAYMMKYQRVNFGEGIHAVFDYLCTTDPQIAATPIKFYLDEKGSKEIEVQIGDVVEFYPLMDCGTEFTDEVTSKNIGKINSEYFDSWKIIYRDSKSFIMPKKEQDE